MTKNKKIIFVFHPVIIQSKMKYVNNILKNINLK